VGSAVGIAYLLSPFAVAGRRHNESKDSPLIRLTLLGSQPSWSSGAVARSPSPPLVGGPAPLTAEILLIEIDEGFD
jgi:hypothetical protein